MQPKQARLQTCQKSERQSWGKGCLALVIRCRCVTPHCAVHAPSSVYAWVFWLTWLLFVRGNLMNRSDEISTCSAAAGTLQNLSREAASRQLIRQQGAVPLLAALLSASDLQVSSHLLLDTCVLRLIFLLCLLAQHLMFASCRNLSPFMSVHCKLRPCVCCVL